MFKIVVLCGVLIAAGTAYNIEDNYIYSDNNIDYEDPVFIGDILNPFHKNHDHIYLEPQPHYADNLKVAWIPTQLSTKVKKDGASQTGLLSTVTSVAFQFIRSIIKFIFRNAATVGISILTALGICNLTPICTKVSSLQALLEVPVDLRSFATPERISKATDFVNTAIKKYRSLQSKQ